MASAVSHLDQATSSLKDVVDAGAPAVASSKQAVQLIDSIELTRRLASVAAVDVLAQIHVSRSYYDHGHANARVMFQHVAQVSGAESHRLDQIRRMVAEAQLINTVWRQGGLPVDKAAVLGRAFANPRTRDRFLLDQKWFLKKARRFNVTRLTKKVAAWVETHDHDGPEPPADPSFERRKAWIAQDYFSKSWRLEAELGSLPSPPPPSPTHSPLHSGESCRTQPA